MQERYPPWHETHTPYIPVSFLFNGLAGRLHEVGAGRQRYKWHIVFLYRYQSEIFNRYSAHTNGRLLHQQQLSRHRKP